MAVPEDAVEAACGMLTGSDSLTDALIEEHRRERKYEDAPADAVEAEEAGPDAAGR